MFGAAPAEPTGCDINLTDRLRPVLPKDVAFVIHHLSTPPRKTDAIYSAPPDRRPDRTYRENHFLTVSINIPQSEPEPERQVIVLGIEIFIYTTAHSTTLFVSKADSTGYLPLLNLPLGTPSPIRAVCATFIRHLVAARRRQGIPLVVSLFARSQGQYLFPGSVDHGAKHVLDDRALVKWWCRVLDPLITSPPDNGMTWKNAKGYLVIPGLDSHETRAFVPRTAAASSSWSLTHPLQRISHYTREYDRVPLRCLIPRFPDDPKSRFRDELDQEAGQSGPMQTAGTWNTVKTLDVFWDMMAFRQECSSGRMTGFIWVVFDDETPSAAVCGGAPSPAASHEPPPVTIKSLPSGTDKPEKQAKRRSKRKKFKLKGPIRPRQPRAKTEQRNYLLMTPTLSPYYYWPVQGRGSGIISETMYKRVVELMLHLDFSSLDKAVASSRRWTNEGGLGSDWGQTVVGAQEPTTTPAAEHGEGKSEGEVQNVTCLVKRKRTDTNGKGTVNFLGAGLVKRKAKEEADARVHVLTSRLVRKKPKAGE
ncbi:histone H3-K56 acetyltransferase, RTT109 [Metarhizium album ARSEF 1941]|uniref:histone acetyltransferase n=1 Tax=Metarhizium album (strain ARSEF 1941) TaxID=1081103 RepID=A0A0B2WKN3_METAS|nr:histone H3-K56 acetyltransferase, RTT109 [Metarhizium album ARSEF 1941]KHN94042.1 histone H3-K56 acetyltransferase, RTT109 [Metarhizium album ARSEF 1941]